MSKMKDIHITAQAIARDYGLAANDIIVNAIAAAFIEGYSARWTQEITLSEASARMKP
jgi:hypothetical protein